MAMMPCPECRREVSDRAAACPHCGRQLSARAGGGSGMPGWVIALLALAGLALLGLVVCGIFGAIVAPRLITPIERSKVGAASGDIGAFNSALALYQADVDSPTYPATLNQLLSDNAAGWAGPYMATISRDPWNNDYLYTSGTENYTIMSVHDAEQNRAETVRYILEDGVLSTLP